MPDLILSILVTYFLLSLFFLLIETFSWWRNQHHSPLRFILLLKDSEQKLEHVVRSLSWMSKMRGIPIRLIVFDYGSQDDTLLILERLLRYDPEIELSYPNKNRVEELEVGWENESAPYILIDLRTFPKTGMEISSF